MPLPPKEMYTIAEIANRWNVPSVTIEDYLLSEKLQSSIYLPQKMLLKYTLQFNHESNSDEDPYDYDIDYSDPDSFRPRQGIFNLNYQDIEWNEQGQAKLEKGGMYLTLPDEEGYFGFDETFVLNRDDVLISLSEVNRFEKEHGITAPISNEKINCEEKIAKTSPNADAKLNPKEKESLLKMVIAMAYDGYRYKPTDKKSSVPGEIVDQAEKLGLSIDVDTVRKWLKEAAGLLPRDISLD